MKRLNLTLTILLFAVLLPGAGCPVSAARPAEAPAAEATRVPLKDALDTLEPREVWQNFYELTRIPRPSQHEEQIRDFLVQFSKDLGLEALVDDAGNVIIRKPAARGMEHRQGVILQAHMDMVPQKTPESTHDFLTDPIEAYMEGEWVVADGTTLGADDGIGIAIAMAILQTQTPLGPIEALFTVDEEKTMSGAMGLRAGSLQGGILINLDSEAEGEFTIGSAGGESAEIETTYAESAAPAGSAFTLSVGGLTGGHSGVDIHRGRGHAAKLLVRFIREASGKYGVRVARIASGTAGNAIPRDATALVVVPASQVDAFLEGVQGYEAIVKAELAMVEPDLKVMAEPASDTPVKVMEEEAQRALINGLYGTPQGVMRMSIAVPGLVETSTNMGIVNIGDGKAEIKNYLRSSVDSALADLGQMIASVWDLAGVEVTFSGGYSGWNPNPNSPVLLLMQSVYQDLYGKDPKVSAVHAGLECGTIVAKHPGMDAISIGPTLQNVHTPSERMEIASVKKVYDLLIETLKQIPDSAAAVDPLPSWNPGPAKESILKFVADVTDPASPSYVPPAERIAVTDNDGTLWTEKPVPAQAAFLFGRIVAMAPDHPEWQTTQPYQAVLEADSKALASLGMEDIETLLFATHAGMTVEEFEATAKAFLDTAKHPRFGVPYTATVYEPMLELLALLQANDFKTFIVSGGGVEFMRVFSEEIYGIPRENVIGSSLQYKFQQTPEGVVLLRQPELVSLDDREMKPVNIQLHIGRRPIMAIGNSDGDLAMFQYTASRKGPYLNVLVVHDDAEREYEVLAGTDAVMAAAAQSPWVFASMKRDFKTVFPTPAPAGPTLDEKIGQMIMAGFRGMELASDNPIVQDIRDRHIGGVVLFDYDVPTKSYDRNISSPEQLKALTVALQNAAETPLLISVDQEGGKIARLKEKYGFPATVSEQQLGTQDDLAATRLNAETMAQALQKAGINFNLAPVIDLNINPDNPIIAKYERSFSADPAVVTRHALEEIDAHHRYGVLTTLKHFPGHGSSTGDSHVGFVDVTETWSEIELEPYKNIIAAGKADAVMTAHIFNTNLDPEYPATLSNPIITGILRDQLGWDGVVISDDMGMGAIADNYGFEEAVGLSVLAGVDILAFANNSATFDPTIPARAIEVIKGLVEDGIISEERIDASYQRIMRLKALLK